MLSIVHFPHKKSFKTWGFFPSKNIPTCGCSD